MNNYIKPEMEIYFIEEEDVLMTSGVTLPADEFDDDTTAAPTEP